MTKEYALKVVIANAACCSTELNCLDDCPLMKECMADEFGLDGEVISEAVRTLKNNK